MNLLSFGFPPVFFSVMAFVIILKSKLYLQKKTKKFFVLILLSFFVCFGYPLTKVYIANSYFMFDGFFFFCLIASLVSVAINIAIVQLTGVKNERD